MKKKQSSLAKKPRVPSPVTFVGELVGDATRQVLDGLKAGVELGSRLPLVGEPLGKAAEAFAHSGRGGRASLAEARRPFADTATAREHYAARQALLLAPNTWSLLSGIENANFAHFDATGQPIHDRPVLEGDFVRITLTGAGYERADWVHVKRVETGPTRTSIVVRPSHDPTGALGGPEVTAHFFTRDAINTLALSLEGDALLASVRGEHEHANIGHEAGGAANAVRHRLIAEAGWGLHPGEAIPGPALGPQQHMWNRFTANLVDPHRVP